MGRILFLTISISLWGHLTQAAPALLISPAALQSEAKAVTSRLPGHLLKTIGKNVQIQFQQLDDHKEAHFSCDSPQPTKPVVAAKVLTGTIKKTNPIIYVHSGYSTLLLHSPNAIRCGRTIREHFQKAVIHELAHLFDLMAPLSETETEFAKSNCNRVAAPKSPSSGAKTKNSALCQNINRTFRFSESSQFLALDNWYNKQETKNTAINKSPDAYVFTAARESFATHFESFLTDPDFSCRKPALARYFSNIFQYPKTCAAQNNFIFSRNEILDLNPDQLYEVHYLYAAPGSTVPSRWGHAMLRLVYCAPERPAPSADCLKDVSHHRVLSFRANIEDFQLNNWKTLTGKYPSQLFVLKFNEVVNEYTQVELRDLISQPLQLTHLQKKLLVEKTLEAYWGYKGRYYFLSNNCADETFAFLAGVFFDQFQFEMQKFMFQDAGLITPRELYQFYQDIGLAKPLPTAPETRLALGYEFPSGNASLEKAFTLLERHGTTALHTYKSLNEFLLSTHANERHQLFNQSVTDRPDQTRALAAAFYILESNQMGRIQSQARKEIAKKISEGDAEIMAQTERLKQNYTDTWENLSLVNNPARYGVPLRWEMDQWLHKLKTLHPTRNNDSTLNADFVVLLKKLIPDLIQELEQSELNLLHFLNFLKQTKQQTKGDI